MDVFAQEGEKESMTQKEIDKIAERLIKRKSWKGTKEYKEAERQFEELEKSGKAMLDGKEKLFKPKDVKGGR